MTPVWKLAVETWKSRFECRVRQPATPDLIREAESTLGSFPHDLLNLFHASNGLVLDWFQVFPIFDSSAPKATWNSIQRANDPEKTLYLARDRDLLAKFLVFASLSGGTCAAIDRLDGTIWYEEEGDLHQTDLNLRTFIEESLKEASGVR